MRPTQIPLTRPASPIPKHQQIKRLNFPAKELFFFTESLPAPSRYPSAVGVVVIEFVCKRSRRFLGRESNTKC